MTDNQKEIMNEVFEERKRQDIKWGEQNHPLADPTILSTWNHRDSSAKDLLWKYELPTADRAKWLCDNAARKGEVTFAHILTEELCESIEASNDPQEMRKELIQLAAVAVQVVEYIDRQGTY